MGRRLVPLELHLGECREGAPVTEEMLTVSKVFALLLEVTVLFPHVFVERLVPRGRPVAPVTLQPGLVVLRPGVGVEVGQVVGPVLTVCAGEDMLTWVCLPEMLRPQPLIIETRPVLTERTFNGLISLFPEAS